MPQPPKRRVGADESHLWTVDRGVCCNRDAASRGVLAAGTRELRTQVERNGGIDAALRGALGRVGQAPRRRKQAAAVHKQRKACDTSHTRWRQQPRLAAASGARRCWRTTHSPRKRTETLRGAQNRAVQPGSMCSSAGCKARVRVPAPASCGPRDRCGAIGQQSGEHPAPRKSVRLLPAQLRHVARQQRMTAPQVTSVSGWGATPAAAAGSSRAALQHSCVRPQASRRATRRVTRRRICVCATAEQLRSAREPDAGDADVASPMAGHF